MSSIMKEEQEESSWKCHMVGPFMVGQKKRVEKIYVIVEQKKDKKLGDMRGKKKTVMGQSPLEAANRLDQGLNQE